MNLFRKKILGGGLLDVIRCDEPSYLVWKWHPEEVLAGQNRKENEIRWGSSIRVKEGSVAVLVYWQENGTAQDFVEGPFDGVLKTKNLPVLSSILGQAYNGASPFQAEVYFINLAQIVQIKFGVPYFDVFDPRFTDFGVPIAVRGTLSFKITDYKQFIRLHRMDSFSLEDFKVQVKDTIIRYVKNTVANIPEENNIPVVQIEKKIAMINRIVEEDITARMLQDFGVTISGVDIAAIEINKESEGYRRLKSVTQDLSVARSYAETEDYIERLKMKRDEEQYALHKQTQTSNILALQIEKQAEVGIAGAKALGQLGENDASRGDLGDGGTGFNPTAMMAGMALGSAVGHNIANTMNSVISSGAIEPDLAAVRSSIEMYNVAIDGKLEGPYDKEMLINLARNGNIIGSTLLWKPGMSNWNSLESMPELKDVLNSLPPRIE